MYTSIYSATLRGLDAVMIQVEVDVSNGLPGFSIVGNVNHQVREAYDRVRTALKNLNVHMPPRRITVNLSPSEIVKTGSGFDLPIAAGILELLDQIPQNAMENIMVAGELGLDGKIRSVRGVLSMVAKAKEQGCKACIVPKDNLWEAAMIGNIKIAGVESLEEFVATVKKQAWKEENLHIRKINHQQNYGDFLDVRGQQAGKRAALLCAAGFHHLLLMGEPGAGKTMIASRIPGLLPRLEEKESLELSSIYSIAGLLSEANPFLTERPFRAPHHTITPQALAGGGRIPQPGEITLAHKGILFLDELPEMNRNSLEILRQPLEEKVIRIARANGRYTFPADFLLVAAMNPCPCGHYPDRNRCSCTPAEIGRYLHKVSQAFLDRIDICVEMTVPQYEDFLERKQEEIWTTGNMREKVAMAHQIQKERYQKETFRFNGEIPADKVGVYCILEKEAEALLVQAFERMKLSGRGCNKILKVARTVADLDLSEKIREEHLAEAIGYRSFDKYDWR